MSQETAVLLCTAATFIGGGLIVNGLHGWARRRKAHRWAIIEAVEDARRDEYVMLGDLAEMVNVQQRRSVHDSRTDRLELERLTAEHQCRRRLLDLTITKRIHT